jgi:zinc and cadmium transporter
MMAAIPYVLAVSAASVRCIAAADLIPMLHRQVTITAASLQSLLVLTGVATIVLLSWATERALKITQP